MAYARPSRYRKSKKSKSTRRPRRNLRVKRAIMFNPNPIFTETYSTPTIIVPQGGFGGTIQFNIDNVPQVAQYSALYRKYRILRAQVIMIPEFNSFDQNQAENNQALSRTSYGQSRIAWAVNDTPATTAPATELDVLKNNGCRIKPVTKMNKMYCKPVPNTKDANGNEMTFKSRYLNFQSSNVGHFGIDYWINQFVSTATGAIDNNFVVYVKLTFQLADPR